VEFLLGVSLMTAVGLQSHYVPSGLGACSTTDKSGLFFWASRLWSQTPDANCRGWVVIWVMCLTGG
jgi:hypothetical protein